VLRIRRRAAGLVVGAALLFVVGTNVQAGWLFVMSSILLGAAVAGTVLPARMVHRVAVTRRTPSEAFVGDEIPVDLMAFNRGRGAKLSILVRDPYIAPATVFLPSVRPGETVTASTLRRASRRGVVDGGTVQVASSAPFGVAEARRSAQATGRTVIYPRVVPVPSLPLLEATRSQGEAAASAGRGPGQDFLGVREYQRGDSLRHVHWPSTARHGSLIVREFEQELPARLVALIDTWADAGEKETALDLCCSVVASVTLAVLGSGHRVALSAACEGEVGVPVEMDRTAALTWLAELRAPGGLSLSAALETVAAGVRSPAAFLLALPSWRPNTARALVGPVAALVARGVRVGAAIIDATSLHPSVQVLGAADLEQLTRELAAAGADVYPVQPEEDLATCLARSPSPVQ
jgi:uncharacterized protein (DUF58 family)